MRPGPARALGLLQEAGHGLHVVRAGAGVGEDLCIDGRGQLAAQHGQTLLLAHDDAHLLEARHEHVLREELLPCGVGKHVRLLRVALRTGMTRFHAVVFLDVVRIFDLVAVDHADLRIVARETHLGLQRENESQKGEADDHRQHDAESGSQSV